MVAIYYKTENRISSTTHIEQLDKLDYKQLLWIDMTNPTDEIKQQVEKCIEVNLQTKQQMEEIESSSRYLESEDLIIANTYFFIRDNEQYQNEHVSFIIVDKILVSIKSKDLRTFYDTSIKIETNPRMFQTGFHVLVALFETRIDKDADFVENIVREVSQISKRIQLKSKLTEEIILEINQHQEITMLMRENIIDKQRVLSGILKSEMFPDDCYPKLRVMIKDTNSLLDYTTFNFERLEYLQDTFLALINTEQNKIIKIFTVVSVLFMPPTLIASIYGMNFKVMPEIDWTYGYVFSLAVMLMSAVITLTVFKRKKWL